MTRVGPEQLDRAKNKVVSAVALVARSVNKLQPFDPDRPYSMDDIEPYDALCDRFIRAVEVCIKYFRTYEYAFFAVNSDTLRDALNVMEKNGLITSTLIWLDMRDVRNRIVHDYLPEQLKLLYDCIMNEFFAELSHAERQIKAVHLA
jgi:hypothetical protein